MSCNFTALRSLNSGLEAFPHNGGPSKRPPYQIRLLYKITNIGLPPTFIVLIRRNAVGTVSGLQPRKSRIRTPARTRCISFYKASPGHWGSFPRLKRSGRDIEDSRTSPRLRKSGAIHILPTTDLHGVERESFN
jgi:hypothetical protein